MRTTLGFIGLTVLLSGCEILLLGSDAHERQRQGAASSLVDYLYPDGEIPPAVSGELPYLELPLRVGIAFVPSRQQSLSLAAQTELMQLVKDEFDTRPFISHIEVIPETYLRTAYGTTGMQQVARLHNVDVMALVSFDQVSISGERDSAVLYWTIVGALLVKGNSNEVQTLIDTAIFDARTGEMLLRAPGTHVKQMNSTFVDNARDRRNLGLESFRAATDEMVTNLDVALEDFKQRVKEGERAQVAWKPGHSGGGSTSIWLIAVLFAICLLRACRYRMLRHMSGLGNYSLHSVAALPRGFAGSGKNVKAWAAGLLPVTRASFVFR